MKENFIRSMPFIFSEEGGYVNNPKDPGGETNLGVTNRSWSAYIGRQATSAEMHALTKDKVTPFYKKNYWDTVHGDELPAGLDYAVLDWSVNSGARRSVSGLQKVLGVAQDGIIGSHTLEAIANQNTNDLIDRFMDERLRWLKTLSTWKTFGNGWDKRVQRVRGRAHKMVADVAIPLPQKQDIVVAQAPKAEQKDVKITETLKNPSAWGPLGGLLSAAGGVLSGAPILQYGALFLLVVGVAVGLYYLYRKSQTE